MAFTTRDNLLSAVQHGDEIAWTEFYCMYKPLILLRGDDFRLNNTEKEELVQLVMLSFFKTSRTFQYDKSRGRSRDYLKCVIQNKACDLMRKRHDGEISTENTLQTQEKLFVEENVRWEQEWREHVMQQALKELRNTVFPSGLPGVLHAFSREYAGKGGRSGSGYYHQRRLCI